MISPLNLTDVAASGGKDKTVFDAGDNFNALIKKVADVAGVTMNDSLGKGSIDLAAIMKDDVKLKKLADAGVQQEHLDVLASIAKAGGKKYSNILSTYDFSRISPTQMSSLNTSFATFIKPAEATATYLKGEELEKAFQKHEKFKALKPEEQKTLLAKIDAQNEDGVKSDRLDTAFETAQAAVADDAAIETEAKAIAPLKGQALKIALSDSAKYWDLKPAERRRAVFAELNKNGVAPDVADDPAKLDAAIEEAIKATEPAPVAEAKKETKTERFYTQTGVEEILNLNKMNDSRSIKTLWFGGGDGLLSHLKKSGVFVNGVAEESKLIAAMEGYIFKDKAKGKVHDEDDYWRLFGRDGDARNLTRADLQSAIKDLVDKQIARMKNHQDKEDREALKIDEDVINKHFYYDVTTEVVKAKPEAAPATDAKAKVEGGNERPAGTERTPGPGGSGSGSIRVHGRGRISGNVTAKPADPQ